MDRQIQILIFFDHLQYPPIYIVWLIPQLWRDIDAFRKMSPVALDFDAPQMKNISSVYRARTRALPLLALSCYHGEGRGYTIQMSNTSPDIRSTVSP